MDLNCKKKKIIGAAILNAIRNINGNKGTHNRAAYKMPATDARPASGFSACYHVLENRVCNLRSIFFLFAVIFSLTRNGWVFVGFT